MSAADDGDEYDVVRAGNTCAILLFRRHFGLKLDDRKGWNRFCLPIQGEINQKKTLPLAVFTGS